MPDDEGGLFTYAYDEQLGACLFLFSGKSNTDADFDRYLAAIDQLIERTRGRTDLAAMIVVDDGNPPPNAKYRQLMSQRVKGDDLKLVQVLVTSSPIIRGVMTVMTWVTKSRFEATTVCATFDEAITWVEARRGPRRTAFNLLLRRARRAAETGAVSPEG